MKLSPACPNRLIGFLHVVALLFLPDIIEAKNGACPISDSTVIHGIRFEGLRHTRPHIVQRELLNQNEQPFSCSAWKIEQGRLEGLDIFSSVELAYIFENDESILVYQFKELPSYIPYISVLKTDQDGFSAGPALASLNFLGRDIRVEMVGRFGGTVEYMASASSPWLGDWPVEFDAALIGVDSYNQLEGFAEKSFRFKTNLIHRIPGPIHLTYSGEAFWISDSKAGNLLSNGNWDWVPRLGAGLLWDGRDRKVHTREGWYQEVQYTQNGGLLGGPAHFGEWLSDTRLYWNWYPSEILHVSSLYRYRTGETGRTIGSYDDFHLGGANSFRGTGPNHASGVREWIVFLENRHTLIDKKQVSLAGIHAYFGLQGVMGLETGNVWNHSRLVPDSFIPGWYGGLHLLIAGVDRLRFEMGSKTTKLMMSYHLGLMEKSQIQRFRSR